jgi:UDP-N-acetylglucosamine 2-epimerase (non-hydrolysing)
VSKVVHVIGARPNFVKMAPVIAALTPYEGVEQVVVHTGQHYDSALSDSVLADLGFRQPDHVLGVGSGTHGEQTARALERFEAVLLEERPDLVVVAGDVNSTLAGALAAAKLGIPVAHVESGLRSGDWSMPEEINRVLTDRLSDLLFVHSADAIENLEREGIDRSRVHHVGNTMIDSLVNLRERAAAVHRSTSLGLEEGGYVLVTLHRPSNVDVAERLLPIAEALERLAARTHVVFPIHPRTRARLEALGALDRLVYAGVACLDALPYVDFLSLELSAGAVLTDSGGIQEETSYLGVRCYTFRDTTERPVTITLGTNTLIGTDPRAIDAVETGAPLERDPIPLWDGAAGPRVAAVLAATLTAQRDQELAQPE